MTIKLENRVNFIVIFLITFIAINNKNHNAHTNATFSVIISFQIFE